MPANIEVVLPVREISQPLFHYFDAPPLISAVQTLTVGRSNPTPCPISSLVARREKSIKYVCPEGFKCCPASQGNLSSECIPLRNVNMSSEPVRCAHRADEFVNRKRIVVCCDGTWNSANDSSSDPTNVSRMAGAVAHKCCSGMPQIIYYHPGGMLFSMFFFSSSRQEPNLPEISRNRSIQDSELPRRHPGSRCGPGHCRDISLHLRQLQPR
jgi:hypothetical protein